MAALPYLGVDVEKLSLDEKAEILFLDQGITTAVILAVIFTVAKTFDPLPEDILRYDLKQPFNLQKGWLVWGGIGLVAAVGGIALTGVALSLFSTETPEREVDSLMQLLPLIGSSNISTLSLVGITGVLAPLLEETVFRGFFMVSLTKWVPTPIAIIISSAAFALAHLTPGEFPQLFILGSVLGLTYAQTRNLITPMVIHGFWNSGVILLLTFLQVQGYDISSVLLSDAGVRRQRPELTNKKKEIQVQHRYKAPAATVATPLFRVFITAVFISVFYTCVEAAASASRKRTELSRNYCREASFALSFLFAVNMRMLSYVIDHLSTKEFKT